MPDNEELSKPTQDYLRHVEPTSDFFTERPLSQHPFFETLYGSLEASYKTIQGILDAVVPLSVTLLRPSGLTRKPPPRST
jgi:hypothetical protein